VSLRRPLKKRATGPDTAEVTPIRFHRRKAATSGLAALSSVLALVALPFFVEAGGPQVPLPAVAGSPASNPAPPGPEAEVAARQPASDAAADAARDPDVAEPQVAEPPAAPDPCAEARTWVATAGLPLPAGVGYHCPSTEFAHQGTACWDADPCPGTGFIAVNMDLLSGASPAYLRHVVAHEVCHILDFQGTGTSTEWGADGCAAAHGAPA
jgi:hypothetical protein